MSDQSKPNGILFAEERKIAIVQYIDKHKKLKVNELCEIFNVSPATIRNDLTELQNAGLLKRTHGGAIPNSKAKFELDSYQKTVENVDQKKAIAKKALEWVEDGDAIAIDTGTTMLCFAELIAAKKNLTIVTNDIEIAGVLEDKTDSNIILMGGNIRKGFHCCVGHIALKCIEGLTVDKAFIATNSISATHGLSTPNLDNAQIKKMMIKMSNQVILLCDSKKFGRTSFVKFADVSDLETIITDSGLTNQQKKEFDQLDVCLEVVPV